MAPPLNVARAILQLTAQDWGLPPLAGICESPIVRPDGTVVLAAGYDPPTRLLYHPQAHCEIADIPLTQTPQYVKKALALIDEVIGEFPFVEEADYANTIALFLTQLLRSAYSGNTPLALVDAPAAGSGKSLIADVASIIATGSSVAMRQTPTSDEEWRKAITSIFLAGHPFVLFDNCDGPLKAPALALALTAETYGDRLLGVNRDVRLSARQTVFAVTGNNLVPTGDLPRRCYWIRLNAKVNRPWQRVKFRHPRLKAYVTRHRGHFIRALLILVRNWYAQGQPRIKTPHLGSFEEWTTMVGGILGAAGVEGFLGNLNTLYEQADPTESQWTTFLAKFFQATENQPQFTVKSFLEMLVSDTHAGLLEALPDELRVEDRKSPARIIGRAFARYAERRFGSEGYQLVRIPTTVGVCKWQVKQNQEVV